MARPAIKSHIKKLSKSEAMYVACAIDCDGSISRYANRKKGSHSWVCQISNNDLNFLLNVAKMVGGGRVSEHKIKHLRPEHNLQYLLCFRVKEMLDLLPQIAPYLVIKQHKALKALTHYAVSC